jgi:hypothetical protein
LYLRITFIEETHLDVQKCTLFQQIIAQTLFVFD